jgi:hypothetical protein
MFRDAFFQQSFGLDYEEVELSAGKVRVCALRAGEKDAFDIAHAKAKGNHFRARLIVATCRDESGAPVFDESDLPRLSAAPLLLVEPLVEAAIRVNRMSDKDAEALEKN